MAERLHEEGFFVRERGLSGEGFNPRDSEFKNIVSKEEVERVFGTSKSPIVLSTITDDRVQGIDCQFVKDLHNKVYNGRINTFGLQFARGAIAESRGVKVNWAQFAYEVQHRGKLPKQGKGQPVIHHKKRGHHRLYPRQFPTTSYRPAADHDQASGGGVGWYEWAEVTVGGPGPGEEEDSAAVVEDSGELPVRPQQRNVETVESQLERLQRQHNNGKRRISLMSSSEASARELIEKHRKEMHENRVKRERHQADLRVLQRDRARLVEPGGPDGLRETEAVRIRAAEEYAEASIKTMDEMHDALSKYVRSLEQQVEDSQTEEKREMRRVLKHLALVQQRVEEQRVAPLTITPKCILQPWEFPGDLKPLEVVLVDKPCPCCLRWFHCGDFVGASCGCIYHLHCAALWFKDAATRCCRCGSRMHPDWLTAWGKEWDEQAVHSNMELGLDEHRERWRKNVGALVVPQKNAYRHVEPAAAHDHQRHQNQAAADLEFERSFSATLEPSVEVAADRDEPRREHSHVSDSSAGHVSWPKSPPLRKKLRSVDGEEHPAGSRPQSPPVGKRLRPIEGVQDEYERDATTHRDTVLDGQVTGKPYFEALSRLCLRTTTLQSGKERDKSSSVEQPLLSMSVKEEDKSSSVEQR